MTLTCPQGDIQVDWARRDRALTLSLAVPQGVRANPVLDRDPARPQTLTLNGASVRLDDPTELDRAGVTTEQDAIRIALAAGGHSMELSEE